MHVTPFEHLKKERQLRFWRAAAVVLIFYGGGTSYIALNQNKRASTAERNVQKLETHTRQLEKNLKEIDFELIKLRSEK
jgi:CHASE3 domain sensor protein